MLAFCAACTATVATEESPQVSASAPDSQTAVASSAQDELDAALQAATTIEEVGQIMKPYVGSGDYETVMRCVDRMLEIDPESQDAWGAKAEMQILFITAEQQELNGIVAEGIKKVSDPAGYVAWVKQYAENNGLKIDLPFVHDYASEDEINTYGVASANYYYGGGVHGEWQNGILTSQGDWVYYSVPAEGYAIYKMRADGKNKQRVGEDNGCCLNVVGDWLYYCNNSENNCIFKMRTDGSERTQVSDDNCKYMAVCGEWIIYASMNEGESLYKMKLDGSERTLVFQSPVMYPYLYGDRIYFRQRDERSFYSVAPDGSDMKQLSQYIEGYCIEGDWIYYFTEDSGMIVKKMRLDGSEQSVVFRFAGAGGFALYLDGNLIVSDTPENSDHDQVISIDLDTMVQTVLVDEWCEAFYMVGDYAYYLNYEEGNVWYYVNLASGEIGKLE
jgi:hypothetical protein